MVNYRAVCRFQDAQALLNECLDHMDDELEPDEARARKHLIEHCKEVAFDNAEDGD